MDGWMPVNSKIFACGGRGRNKRFTYGLREKKKRKKNPWGPVSCNVAAASILF
jgi:hypothetical protein